MSCACPPFGQGAYLSGARLVLDGSPRSHRQALRPPGAGGIDVQLRPIGGNVRETGKRPFLSSSGLGNKRELGVGARVCSPGAGHR